MGKRKRTGRQRRDSGDSLPSYQQLMESPSRKQKHTPTEFQKGSVVWAKVGRHVPWPAVVVKILPKGRASILWVPFSINMVRNEKFVTHEVDIAKLQDFDSCWTENKEKGFASSFPGFQQAVKEGGKLHGKELNGKPTLPISATDSPPDDEDDKDSVLDSDEDEDTIPPMVTPPSEKSPRVKARGKKNMRLVNFISESKTLLKRLVGVAKGTVKSHWADLYCQIRTKQQSCAFGGYFGPINEIHLKEKLSETMMQLFIESKVALSSSRLIKTNDDLNFVLEVWVPEAICFALERKRKMTKEAAIAMVSGPPPPLFPEEVAEVRLQLFPSARYSRS